MDHYETTDPYLAATLLYLGYKMTSHNTFEDTEEIRRVIKKYREKGIKVELKVFNEYLKFLGRS